MTEFSFTWISFGGSHLLRSAHQKCSCPVFGGFYLINRLANGCLQPLVIGEIDRVVFTFTVGWAHYFVGLFQANALLSQWLVFSSVQRDRSTFLFICSTSSTWTTDIENIFETTELRPKQNHWHPEPRKHSIHPLVCFTPFFSALCDFYSKFFGFHQRVSPSFVSTVGNTMDVIKSQKVPFSIFQHCVTVQKTRWKTSHGSPFNYFSYFATNWSFASPEGSPFAILSPNYSADFGRSRLFQCWYRCRLS